MSPGVKYIIIFQVNCELFIGKIKTSVDGTILGLERTAGGVA